MKEQKNFNLSGNIERPVEEVEHALATADQDIVLDMRAATFISVEGLEWLEELLLRSVSRQSAVRFVNVPPSIYKVFKVAHIDSLLQACGAPAAASGPVC